MSKEIERPNTTALWHTKTADEAIRETASSREGLTSEEAKRRLERYGKNEIGGKDGVNPWLLLWEQFSDFMIVVLVIAAIVAASVGDVVEAIAILVIVVLAGVLGFLQEYRAGKAIESLKKMASPKASVLRDGKEIAVPSDQIVPGDVLIIHTGDRVAADARLIEAKNLKTDEAALTGESLPVEKTVEPLPDKEASVGDRKNMLYMGSASSYGKGAAVVTATGMQTEFGKIADLLQSAEKRKTPLQENLDALGRKLGVFSIALAAVISVVGLLQGYTFVEMFIWGVALAVGIIPEALPAVVTISLALGVRRMVKRRALVRKLPAVETLGATRIICSDKTGTLTKDEMTARKIYAGGDVYVVEGAGYKPEGAIKLAGKSISLAEHEDLRLLLEGGALCSDTKLTNEKEWDIVGDPTEGAVIVAAEKAGVSVEELRKSRPRADEVPFSSERKMMTTINETPDGRIAYAKGAPEVVLDKCSTWNYRGDAVPLDAGAREQIMAQAEAMGADALRVLGFAYRKAAEGDAENSEKDMVFAGLVGMIDPPRPEAIEAIKVCERAGIKPVMITGDHKITAVAVAKELGVLKGGDAISGAELERMSEEEFERRANHTEVFARISPEHKLKIVDALMRKDNVVAMTGDGVNDAPALKKADIGVAMGITGTDVSKEAADMILTDDNFASIVSAVEEGRGIFENIRKYLVFLLSGNMGTVFGLIATLFAGLPLPLYAVHILFINFIMDGLIAIALGVEPPEPGIMDKRPRNVKEGILNPPSLWYIGLIGLWIGAITFGVFAWHIGFDSKPPADVEAEAVTLFFLTLIFARLFNGFSCRSPYQSSFKLGFFSNPALLVSSFVSLALTVAVSYFAFMQEVMQLVWLKGELWLIAAGTAFSLFIVVEVWKLLRKEPRR
ncbi:MAG: HAD-IC family P-type ATPase [Ignavibacteriales bacterium]|nr:HAD-IC family P-type ATPase [Ignavibacteriales bacterium]